MMGSEGVFEDDLCLDRNSSEIEGLMMQLRQRGKETGNDGKSPILDAW